MKWILNLIFTIQLIITLGVAYAALNKKLTWKESHPSLNIAAVIKGTDQEIAKKQKTIGDYLEKALGVRIHWQKVKTYDDVRAHFKEKSIILGRLGPASYAQSWKTLDQKLEPLVGEIDINGDFGYHSVIVVKKDSPFKTLADLKGKSIAFTSLHSTSGFQAPRHFLNQQGFPVETYFSSTPFSGNHENVVADLVAGNVHGAATWWRSKNSSNLKLMEEKGLINSSQWRILWKSPKLPSTPWAMPTYLPLKMRREIQDAFMEMPMKNQMAWKALTNGKAKGYKRVTHNDYREVVKMVFPNSL